jgi:hypothetical protein
LDREADDQQDVGMKRFWRSAISVAVGSVAGLAFYMIGGNVVYAIHGTSRLPTYDPLLVTSCILTFPVTAAATLAMHALIRRAYGSR